MSLAQRMTIATVMARTWLPLLAVLVAGCNPLEQRLRPEFCMAHPTDEQCLRAYPPDVGDPGCTSNASCMAPTPVCDLAGSRQCVQCTSSDSAACTATTPVCGTDSTCHGCTSHAQCSSSVCLADGSCSDETNVAYVQSDGTGSAPCTKAAPCGTLDDALNTTKPIVKIATGLVKGTKTTSINNKTVTIVADAGATLTRGLFDGAILEVRGNSDVKIFDLDITGAVGAGADGIDLMAAGSPSLSLTRAKVDNNQGIGISATGGTLIVSQTTVSGNTGAGISATGGTLRVTCSTIGGTAVNTGGGISISGAQFDLANNFIVSNGGPLAVFGGVKIDGIATSTGVHRLEFNTITANQTSGTLTAGVLCSAIAMPLTFANNIVFRNGSGMQVEGNGCVWNYSDIGQAITGLADINADPLFVNAAQGDFHIQATSPARDAADPRSTEGVDFDGDARPQDVHSDMGADERKP